MGRFVTFVLMALCSTALAAQQAARAFEVASVKPNVTEGPPSMTVPNQGSVVIANVPLINILTNAFATPPFRIVGAPDWVRRERFDITAKPPDGVVPDLLAMLRTLLQERFKLRAHRESS
jgi:uncharacterized protein (TIGR03435 family)